MLLVKHFYTRLNVCNTLGISDVFYDGSRVYLAANIRRLFRYVLIKKCMLVKDHIGTTSNHLRYTDTPHLFKHPNRTITLN